MGCWALIEVDQVSRLFNESMSQESCFHWKLLDAVKTRLNGNVR